MASRDRFSDWLEDVASDNIVVSSDLVEEARENMWSFSLTSDEARSIAEDRVIHFIADIIAARESQMRRRLLPRMLFYLWHDEMAGRLCFSMVSSHMGAVLPFSCPTSRTPSMIEIVRSFLESDYLDGLPLHEMHEDGSSMDNDVTPECLRVFALELPRGSSGPAPWSSEC